MTTNGTTTNNQAVNPDLRTLSTLIFDLDGVIWRGSEPIEGAAASVARLRAAGKRCLYCTNNSKATQKQFADKLRNMGIELHEDDVISSSGATAMYLSAQFTGPFLVYVIGEEGIITALQKIGAHVVADNDVTDETMVDCVVVGIDRAFNYDKLRIAQRLIHKGAHFIATNRDNTFPTENGIVPGAGSIVSSVEAASGVAPVTIGKPRPAMVHLVMNKFGVAPHEVAMIGDRLDTDIACARRAGIAALFVATGVTPMQQARRGKGELRADAFFEDLPALADAILSDTPYQAPPIAAQTAAVVQGTTSGLQNATDAQPEAGPVELAPLEEISEPEPSATDAGIPPAESFSDEFPTVELADVSTTADSAPAEETIVWDEEPTADSASVLDDAAAPAVDDAATPGMAEVIDTDITQPLPDNQDVPDATENWDDIWFATEAETAETESPLEMSSSSQMDTDMEAASTPAGEGSAANDASPTPFDLDFDLSIPETPAIDRSTAVSEGTSSDATKPEDDSETDSNGFNWKLD